MAYYKEKKRNTPIATLIKNYINKKSGKVADSRGEIQTRFDYLDWKDQVHTGTDPNVKKKNYPGRCSL